jgi:TRAP-type mannitol/chloroaromatic compound transport system substrate-binding protein
VLNAFGVQTDYAINAGRVIAADQILPRLRDGRLDAAEWIGPYDDELLGLHTAARYYYAPGWWEPSTTNELMVSRRALAELPADLRLALQTACAETFLWTRREYDLRNVEALARLRASGVQLRRFSPALMGAFAQESERLLLELERQDPERFGYVAAEWRRFRSRIRDVIAITQFSPEQGRP